MTVNPHLMVPIDPVRGSRGRRQRTGGHLRHGGDDLRLYRQLFRRLIYKSQQVPGGLIKLLTIFRQPFITERSAERRAAGYSFAHQLVIRKALPDAGVVQHRCDGGL